MLAALATAVTAFAVYWRTLAPTVTGEDSGELIAAAYTLGIPHPPGYPLWCLLAHPFTYLPFGTVAWRVNLASAVFAAATVFVMVVLVRSLTGKRWAGVLAGLGLAFSGEFWEQAIIAEVYTLHALLFALCLLCLWKWKTAGKLRYIAICGVISGAGLGAHYTMILLVPLFLLFVSAAQLPTRFAFVTKTSGWSRFAVFIVCFVLGSCVFLYLPIRSLANPAMDWGNPETLGNFLDVLLRRQFAFIATESPRSLTRFLVQVGVFWGETAGAMAVPLLLAGIAGMYLLIRCDRAYGLLLVGSAVVAAVGAMLFQNFDQTREWLSVMSVFWIPAQMALAMGIGVLSAHIPATRLWKAGSVLVGSAILVSLLCTHWKSNDKSHYYWAEDYARNVFATLPPGTIYVPRADHATFPLLYFQVVEGVRSDVSIARRYGYFDVGLVSGMPSEPLSAIGFFPKRRQEAEILAWLLAHDSRPLYFSYRPQLPPNTQSRIISDGILFHALRPNERALPSPWSRYRWRNLGDDRAEDDYTAAVIRFEIYLAEARAAFEQGHATEAHAKLEAALEVYGREPATLNNAGVTAARAGQYGWAERYFREALTLDSTNAVAKRNLERLSR